jgi:ribosomal protein S18 acetylase RimI-like enzyme
MGETVPPDDTDGSVIDGALDNGVLDKPVLDNPVLDNPVWHSMTGSHRGLCTLNAGAGRYHWEITPFGGLADPTDPACWADLARLLDGHSAALVVDPDLVPEGWAVTRYTRGAQMLGTGLAPAPEPDAVPLTSADVPEMLALVERARPGPFLPRTVEMGKYIGIRRGGELIAMAGERLHPTGWTEISAVCTDGTYRGTGLATRLVRAVAEGIRARGEEPFLHVAEDNLNALRLYEALGFHRRRWVDFVGVKKLD